MTTTIEAFQRFAWRLAGDERRDRRGTLAVDPEHAPVGAYYTHLLAAKEAFYLGDLERAEAELSASDAFTAVLFGVPTAVEHRFWHALLDAERHRRASRFARVRLVARVAAHLRAFERWAASCPENFDSYRALIAAELDRMHGRRSTRARYAEAIAVASRVGCPERGAVARERLGAFIVDEEGPGPAAAARIDEAILAYRRLGAYAKASALEATRDGLLS
jgi:hypothetical protein